MKGLMEDSEIGPINDLMGKKNVNLSPSNGASPDPASHPRKEDVNYNKSGHWKRVTQKQRVSGSTSELGENLGKRKSLICSNQSDKKRNGGETWAQRLFSSESKKFEDESHLSSSSRVLVSNYSKNTNADFHKHGEELVCQNDEKPLGLCEGHEDQVLVESENFSLVTLERVSVATKKDEKREELQQNLKVRRDALKAACFGNGHLDWRTVNGLESQLNKVQCGDVKVEKKIDEKIEQFISWVQKHRNKKSLVAIR
ncbi:hypothetical protein LWI28_026153 [Acer negundo]|uniref:Uncharacterized protein n=1 Tax=Acer negundo TaxID=4023 RepID=A0AAD5J1B7_ACENE|nr:hypothetical protein LWI28_026153 [Acer negundo]